MSAYTLNQDPAHLKKLRIGQLDALADQSGLPKYSALSNPAPQGVPSTLQAGIEAAARWVDQRREDFYAEHGHTDPDTGAVEYGSGPNGQIALEYDLELSEIAEGIRALAAAPAAPQAESQLPAGPVSTEPSSTGWLPIETAPKNGCTLLLGYWNSHGNWFTLRGQWFSEEVIYATWEDPDLAAEGWYETPVEIDDTPNCFWTEPTHWQPLPSGPTQLDANVDPSYTDDLELQYAKVCEERDHLLATLTAQDNHPTVQAHQSSAGFPASINDELIEILGRPNFACADLARILRIGGLEIKNRSENEQAVVIFTMLQHYVADPDHWKTNFGQMLSTMLTQHDNKGAA